MSLIVTSIPLFQFQRSNSEGDVDVAPKPEQMDFNSKGPIQSLAPVGDRDGESLFQFQRSNSEAPPSARRVLDRRISIPKVQFRAAVRRAGCRGDRISIPKVQFRAQLHQCWSIGLFDFNSKGPIQSPGSLHHHQRPLRISIPKVQFRAGPIFRDEGSTQDFNSKGPIQSTLRGRRLRGRYGFQFQRSNSEWRVPDGSVQVAKISIPKVQFRGGRRAGRKRR